MLIAVGLSGCNEQNKQQIEKLVSVSISTLLLTIEDLPDGYSEYYNGTEYTSEFSSGPTTESFAIWFSKGNISNQSECDLVTCELNKFNSINDANEMYDNTIAYMKLVGDFKTVDGSINILGYESEALTKPGYTDIISFRISNVIVVMGSTNYSSTIGLARIVEQRIYDSLK